MTCPNCGEEVPPKAKACPECGSCEETGWSEAAKASGLNLPDEDFDYDDYVKRELGEGNPKPRVGWFWWMVGVVVLVIFWMLLLRW